MSGRRKTASLVLSGAAAILPFAALTGASTSADAAQPAYSPPRSPLLLTRTLHSPLADGKEVVARRTYAITIVPDGDGYRVDGELVECEVDAPPALRALAEIERRRPEVGLFPMRLDRRGMIVGGNTLPSAQAVQQAAAVSQGYVARAGTSHGGDRQQANAFVRQVEGQQAITRWPEDLFRPASGNRRLSQPIPLPDGRSGQVIVEITAHAGSDGASATIERTVTTELDAAHRVTREEWSIRQAG